MSVLTPMRAAATPRHLLSPGFDVVCANLLVCRPAVWVAGLIINVSHGPLSSHNTHPKASLNCEAR